MLLPGTPVMAQIAAPSCSVSPGGAGASTAISGVVACVAELDGKGKQQLIIGHVSGGTGYVFILNNNGSVRSKLCWGGVNFCPEVVP
jgi:hypothetical protein